MSAMPGNSGSTGVVDDVPDSVPPFMIVPGGPSSSCGKPSACPTSCMATLMNELPYRLAPQLMLPLITTPPPPPKPAAPKGGIFGCSARISPTAMGIPPDGTS